MSRKLSTKEILEQHQSSQIPPGMELVKVVLHDIRSLHNVGSIFRSSDAFGVSELLISGYTPRPPRPEITKTAIGAEEFVPWKDVIDIKSELLELKNEGYSIIGLEQTDQSILLPDFEITNYNKICLVLGNEVTGIHDDLIPLIDVFISIPQFGQKHSLNVSVATGVMLYGLLQKYWQSSIQ